MAIVPPPGLSPGAPPAMPTPQTSPYGKNNENLPENIIQALRQLIAKAESDNRQARMDQIKRIQRQREFFKGNQNIFWHDQASRWARVTDAGLGLPTEIPESMVRYDYVENLYRVECLLHISMIRENPPRCQYRPQDFDVPEDVVTAREAKKVGDFVSTNNELDERIAEAIWFLDHDGVALSYTYWEVNKELYGRDWYQPTKMDTQQIADNRMICPECATETPAAPPMGPPGGATAATPPQNPIAALLGAVGGAPPAAGPAPPTPPGPPGMPPGAPPTPPVPSPSPLDALGASPPAPAPQTCPECGAPMGPENFAPEAFGDVEVPDGDPEEVPRGQERTLFMGGLEVAMPFYARSLRECGWLTWEAECPRALVKTIYPLVKDQTMTIDSNDVGDNEEARNARLALASTSYGRSTTDSYSNLVTFRRSWIRPWYFHSIEDEDTVRQLVQAFPEGCYVAFAGADYCESRNEQLEKRWALRHAFIGDGMIRDGWLTDFVDMQRKINTGENIKFEIFERGLGSRFIDGKAVDFDAYIEQGAQAVNEFEMELRPGESARDKIYDSPPAPVSEQLVRDLDSMRTSRSEKITGNFAAAYGGDTGPNDTARGILEVKDSAMGRMGYFKQIVNGLYADTIMNLIRCFRENRKRDVRYAIEGPAGELDSQLIKLDQLRGNCYAITQAEDSYPVSPSQKRAVLLTIINGPPGPLQQALFSPENYDMVRWATGSDVKLPGEQARRKQMREIERMKRGEQVQVDVMLDQHDYEIGACNEWASSEDGQNTDPQVRMAVAQHMTEHMKGKAYVEKIQAALQAEVAGMTQQPGAPPPDQGAQPAPPMPQ